MQDLHLAVLLSQRDSCPTRPASETADWRKPGRRRDDHSVSTASPEQSAKTLADEHAVDRHSRIWILERERDPAHRLLCHAGCGSESLRRTMPVVPRIVALLPGSRFSFSYG